MFAVSRAEMPLLDVPPRDVSEPWVLRQSWYLLSFQRLWVPGSPVEGTIDCIATRYVGIRLWNYGITELWNYRLYVRVAGLHLPPSIAGIRAPASSLGMLFALGPPQENGARRQSHTFWNYFLFSISKLLKMVRIKG